MTFDEIIDKRYSVRKYAPTPVEDEKITAVLEAGRKAPTAKNIQPHHIFVLKSTEAVEKIRSITNCAFDAPVLLLICADRSQAWVNPFNHESYAQTDTAIVTTCMMLKATELGLGTCWVGWFDTERVKREVGLPENLTPIHLLPLGYPAEDARPSRQHSSRRELSETVTVL